MTKPYVRPNTRSCAVLAGQKLHPVRGSILDQSQWVTTAKPAGSRGAIVAVGDKLYEAADMTKPIRLFGNNSGGTPYNPFPYDETLMDELVEKLVTMGINFIRWHHIETYLFWTGSSLPPYSAATFTMNTGDWRAASQNAPRWAEFDLLMYKFAQAGIYVSIGLASSNLGWDTAGKDRWDKTPNQQGAAVATIVNGSITKVDLVTKNTIKYPHPPTVVVLPKSGSGGVKAKLKAVLDANGILSRIDVIDGGVNYANDNSLIDIIFVGGTGRGGLRIRLDDWVFDDVWTGTLNMFLSHVNPRLGIAYKDHKGIAFIECLNEAHLAIQTADRDRSDVPTSLKFYTLTQVLWQAWLYDRYQTIGKLNDVWQPAVPYESFTDPRLYYALADDSTGATPADRKKYFESRKWMADADIKHYQRYVARIRELGWKGLTSGLDMTYGSYSGKIHAEAGTDIQTYHAYPYLVDTYAKNDLYSGGPGKFNGPGYIGSNSARTCVMELIPGKPKMWTEAGWPVPGKFRALLGMTYGALSSMYGFSGITIHADTIWPTRFGPNKLHNSSRNFGLYPHQWMHDPCMSASLGDAIRLWHRRDMAELTPGKTYYRNNPGLGLYETPETLPTFATTAEYGYQMIYGSLSANLLHVIHRVEALWEPNYDKVKGLAGFAEQRRVDYTQILSEMGFKPTDESYAWVSRGNTSTSNEQTLYAVRYSINKEYFQDRVAGIEGINTPRTQMGVASKQWALFTGSHVQQAKQYVANPGNALTRVVDKSFVTNFLGNRFWTNIKVNSLDDAVHMNLSSATMEPISTSKRMLLTLAPNYYNKSASFAQHGLAIASIPVLNGGAGFRKPPNITVSGGGGTQSATYVVAVMNGTSVKELKVLFGGYGFTGETALPTITWEAVDGGSGLVLGTPTFTDADPGLEIKVDVPWATDGFEGWPIEQQNHVTDIDVDNIDMSKPWRLYELSMQGERVSGGEIPVRVLPDGSGINIRIDSTATVMPAVYFELVQGVSKADRFVRPRTL